VSRVLKREWTTAEGWRDTKAGMWAWLIQRAAAMVLLVVVAVHLVNPFRRGVQAALLLLVPRPRAPRRVRGAPRLRPTGVLAPGALRPGAGALGGDLRARVGVAVVLMPNP